MLSAAALLFWGWQSGLLPIAAALAVILECPRFVKARWEMTDADIGRVWNFCALLGLATAIYAFTSNEGFANLGKLASNPDLQNTRTAGAASTQAAFALIRWLPLVFFLFAAVQAFSARQDFPLEAISPYLRFRRKKLLKQHRPPPAEYLFNVAWPYFVLCLAAASAHAATDNTYFWGLCVLVAWALWTRRSPGFGRNVWLILLAVVILGGFFGQRGFGELSRLVDMADGYNPGWLAMFLRQTTSPEQTRTEIGHIGQMELSSQIVLRVTPVNGSEVPTYLREATYRTYRPGRVAFWTVGEPIDDFSPVSEDPPNSGHWTIHSGQTNRSLVNITCYLEGYDRKNNWSTGLLPLPLDCDHLENFFAYGLQNNSVGAVLCQGPYFISYNASFGLAGTIDTPPGGSTRFRTNNVPAENEDLAVPDKEKPALDQIIATLPLAGLNDAQKLRVVDRYFAANYQYSLWQPSKKSTDTNETALADFLLHTHSGHCEYFATATVLLLRELHIPARYAVGYVVHEPAGKHYVVRSRDAHAWCLAWDATTRTWQIFDTTPASWVAAEGGRARFWQSLTDFFNWLHYQFARFRYGQSHLRPYLLMALVPVLGYFLYQIIRHRRRHQPAGAAAVTGPDWPGLDSELYLLEQKLAALGLVRRPGQPLTTWLNQVAEDPARENLREPLRQVLRLHYQYRFDPRGLTPAERAELRRQAQACLKGW
jgi:hypothetical protein